MCNRHQYENKVIGMLTQIGDTERTQEPIIGADFVEFSKLHVELRKAQKTDNMLFESRITEE